MCFSLSKRKNIIRVVIAPRGELSDGALSLKAKRKRLFIVVSKILGLYKRLTWQASSSDEAEMIKGNFPTVNKVVVARDLPDLSFLVRGCQFNGASQRLRVIFLSRISPMKNLYFALEVLREVKVPVDFDIWGTEEDSDYWDECKKLISSLPSNVLASYRGPVSHDFVSETMAKYDLLFLPSLGENYGHVIAESVSVGTPVLISDRTPWRGLESNEAGWDLPLEHGVGPFVAAIESAYLISRNDGSAWRNKTYGYAKSFLVSSVVVDSNRSLFV